MRIGLVQMHCEKGTIAHNLETMARYLHEAVDHKVDILGFPEMSITGYADPTRHPEAVISVSRQLVERSPRVDIPDGHHLAVSEGGNLIFDR